MPSKSEDEKFGHIIMNNTIKLTSLYFMAASGSGDQVDNGGFQNQNLQESTSGRQFRCRKASSPIWAPLKRKKAPRGNPQGSNCCALVVSSPDPDSQQLRVDYITATWKIPNSCGWITSPLRGKWVWEKNDALVPSVPKHWDGCVYT